MSSSSSLCHCSLQHHLSNKKIHCDPISTHQLEAFYQFRSYYLSNFERIQKTVKTGRVFQLDELFWSETGLEAMQWNESTLSNAWVEAKPISYGTGLGLFAKKCIPLHTYEDSCLEDIHRSSSSELTNIHATQIKEIWSPQNHVLYPKRLAFGTYQGVVLGKPQANLSPLFEKAATTYQVSPQQIQDYAILYEDDFILSCTRATSHWSHLINHSRNYANLHLTAGLMIYQKNEITKGEELLWDYGSDYWLKQLLGKESLGQLQKTKHVEMWQRIYNVTENYSYFLQEKHFYQNLPEKEQFGVLELIFQEHFARITLPPFLRKDTPDQNETLKEQDFNLAN